MTDRIPTQVLANGAIRYGVYDATGTLLRYEYIKPEDEPTEPGTPLTKATLLQDSTAAALGLGEFDNPSVDDAFQALHSTEVTSRADLDGILRREDTTFQKLMTGRLI